MPYFYRNNIKYSGGSDSVDLTMAEYKELEANGKVVQDTTYYIIDADENIPSRPNLLINSNFANPVNQRGVTNKIGSGYWIDRWVFASDKAGSSGEINDYITLTAVAGSYVELFQLVEFPETYAGKTISLSVKCKAPLNNPINIRTLWDAGLNTFGSIENIFYGTGDWQTIKLTLTLPEISFTELRLFDILLINSTDGGLAEFESDTSIDIEWAKAELGDHATPYVPRLYAEELQLCKRYFKRIYTDALPYYIVDNAIEYHIPYGDLPFSGLRKKPTVTLNGSQIVKNNLEQTGFNIEVASIYNSAFHIRATKNSHGITQSNYAFLLVDCDLDAEL